MFILLLALLMIVRQRYRNSTMTQRAQQGGRGYSRDVANAQSEDREVVLTGFVLVLVAGMGCRLYSLIKERGRGSGA
jgi:hypothetical protein